MIEINLLPEELKRKESALKKFDAAFVTAILRNVSFAKFAVIICAALALAHLLLFAFGMAAKANLAAVGEKCRLLGDREKDVMALKLKSDTMDRKNAAIARLMEKRFEWSKKLNDLSDSMTAGIWLGELVYDEKGIEVPAEKSGTGPARASRYMTISGYASSKGEEGTASIGKFIKALKENEGFYGDFSDIELGSIRRDKVEGQDVMSFRITCLFGEAK